MQYPNGREDELETSDAGRTALYSKYPPEALKVAKLALLAHASRIPAKKRDITQAIQPHVASGEFSRSKIKEIYEEADKFLKEKFALSLIDLPTVNMGPENQSAQRGEIMLVSKVVMVRQLLLANAPSSQRMDWGLVCLVLMMIVLNGDGVDFDEILDAVTLAQLFETSINPDESEADVEVVIPPEDIRAQLSAALQRVVSQRYLEVTKLQPNRAPDPSRDSGPSDPQEFRLVYYIGPYSRATVSRKELLQVMLRLHFPDENITSEEFQSQHEVLLKSLNQKLDASSLP